MRRVNGERGAVALFIVIFSALLITTITVAFVRIMVQNQQQATTIDLSKSALDSAFAGVEDAKRAIVIYRSNCLDTDGELIVTTECENLDRAIKSQGCNTIQESGIAGSPGDDEVLVRQNEGDELLNQAYTCVKIKLDTPDFVGTLSTNDTRLIPLRATGDVDRVVIEWFSQKDLQNALSGGTGDNINLTDNEQLPKENDWPANRPSIVRFQLIQFGDSFRLSDFNNNSGDKVNNGTLFLMPSTISEDPDGTINLDDKVRRSKNTDVLRRVQCNDEFSTTSPGSQFACRAVILLPDPIGPDNYENRTAYLMIDQIYSTDTTFSVSMMDGPNVVSFSSVQPIVDSTGRANDLFRRIRSRVEVETSSIPPVQAAVDISGSLCKAFFVTDDEDDYTPSTCSN